MHNLLNRRYRREYSDMKSHNVDILPPENPEQLFVHDGTEPNQFESPAPVSHTLSKVSGTESHEVHSFPPDDQEEFYLRVIKTHTHYESPPSVSFPLNGASVPRDGSADTRTNDSIAEKLSSGNHETILNGHNVDLVDKKTPFVLPMSPQIVDPGINHFPENKQTDNFDDFINSRLQQNTHSRTSGDNIMSFDDQNPSENPKVISKNLLPTDEKSIKPIGIASQSTNGGEIVKKKRSVKKKRKGKSHGRSIETTRGIRIIPAEFLSRGNKRAHSHQEGNCRGSFASTDSGNEHTIENNQEVSAADWETLNEVGTILNYVCCNRYRAIVLPLASASASM